MVLFIFITPYGDKVIFINIFKFYVPVFLISFVIIRVLIFDLIFRNFNKIDRFNRNAAVLGINEGSILFYNKRKAIRENSGLNIIGFIDLNKSFRKKYRNINVLGNIDHILDLSIKYNFSHVFIVESSLPVSKLFKTVDYLRANNLFVHVSENGLKILSEIDLFDIYGTDNRFIDFNFSRFYYRKYFKIVFDYIFSILFLIIILPILFLILILIKLTSKGPALFINERIGLNRKKFNFIKFRSMHRDTEENIKTHRESIESFYNGKESGKIKVNNINTRVTNLGRFLRKFSLDELPQFVNVLKKDMSVVGPRPCMEYEVGYFRDWKKYRFNIKPGITGLWQAYGRSRVNFEEMSILEYYYYSGCSFSLDLKIGFDTVKVLIFGIGGY
ncbi:MAG: sugar transferase [Actinobacteria bacterium]|nr:sugar transferase [Actinomycetota bacterium]